MTILSWVVLQQAASAATYKVTTAADDGAGSLRDAITKANSNVLSASDTIVFEIPAEKDRSIDLVSELPHLTSSMAIINKGEPVTVQRSSAFGTPTFRIFTISSGNSVAIEGLIIARGTNGILNRGSRLTMRNCTLQNNSGAGGAGGAIENRSFGEDGPAILTLTNCTLTANSTSRASLNPADGGGGAIRNYAFKPSSSSGNTATATLNNCVLRENFTFYVPPPEGTSGLPIWATPDGAAIANIGIGDGVASVTLNKCILETNRSESRGGAIHNVSGTAGSLVLRDCVLRGNSATGGGGAIYNHTFSGAKPVSIERCTFDANQAVRGGAILNSRGELALTNCTLNENIASSGDATEGGGAIFNSDFNSGATVVVTNCTFCENRGDNEARAASIYNAPGGTLTTANTIYVRPSGADPHFVNEGTFTSRGHNISNDLANGPLGTAPGGLLNGPADRRLTNPGVQDLANNLGPTPTCALEPDSVAINAGNDSLAPSTDQRGFARSGVSDIGAYERTQAISISAKPGRLGNISTRLGVETGDNVLIGGFIVTGTEPKRVMLRAIGTSLPFANRLANPSLELFDSAGVLIESNDNWVDSENKQAIIDSTIPPTSELEPAIVAYLPADGSAYTAVVRGVEGGSGIGLVEIYDLDNEADSKLANISTRGLVQAGDNVMIAGTIITGQASQKVIIRAIGPSLSVEGRLADPVLELFDGNGARLAANDNWRTGGQEQEITATGVAPSHDAESAIVYQLPANNASYTATVRGVGDTTGIAVVEVYALAPVSLDP